MKQDAPESLAGVTVGFAFLTKMMQGFLTLPALALAYLVAAPTSLASSACGSALLDSQYFTIAPMMPMALAARLA